MSPGVQITDTLLARSAETERSAASALLRTQHADGYWWAELTADTTLESDWILLRLWQDPELKRDRERIEKACASILRRRNEDGGFPIYAGGPSEISASVKAYFALKLAGQNPEALPKLRERILDLGGLQSANSYTKINLSLFGLYPREHTPTVPPEMMLAGNFVYEMSSWSRAIAIPLAIVQALTPRPRPVPAGFTLDELLLPGKPLGHGIDAGIFSWRGIFERLDGFWKFWEKRGLKGVRQKAIDACRRWTLDHTRDSDGVAAIYPPMMYTIMALDALGYAADSPERLEAQRQFERLIVDRDGEFYFQPCFSVVWDTAIAAYAVGESGGAPAAAMRRCGDWLLSKEVRKKGDWSVKRPDLEPSGWYFEFANEFYPDIDDTAMVLLALDHARGGDVAAWNASSKRAVNWLLGMQSKDGGWAAFDVDNNLQALTHVPFADHNAMLDPTCPDITGRVLEGLMRHGLDAGHAAIQRGVQYLVKHQESDGSWYGRWGVGYVYGTCFALRGLQAAGESDREAHVLRGGEWLRSIQNADGGWGESCESYDKGAYAGGKSTPSQTAWAILGLIAGGDTTSSSLHNGVDYLCKTQTADGTWDEAEATGTGFPRVFYLNYHLYRNSFPLLALATYRKSQAADR